MKIGYFDTYNVIVFSVSLTDALIPEWSGFEWYSITMNSIFLISFTIIGGNNHSVSGLVTLERDLQHDYALKKRKIQWN